MKRIKTSGKDLLLPEDWMELPEKQRRKGFELFAAVMAIWIFSLFPCC